MSQKKLRIGLIGCGLIGKKRVLALNTSKFSEVAEVTLLCDLVEDRARQLAGLVKKGPGQAAVYVTTDSESAAESEVVDAVMIATLNASLAPLALKALRAGKHVLVEKPAAIHTDQLQSIAALLEHSNLKFRVGYNHRYHPAFLKLNELLKTEDVGRLMMIRGRYGHGGRVGYEKEWRANPELSGGGELIDQGVHLIDLAGSLMAPVVSVQGKAQTLFWNMPVDDNAFIHLEDQNGCPAWLHASCTEWKNLFSFEVYYQKAKFHIEGLGGSYGVERLTHYQMQPLMGPPPTTAYEFPMGDESWAVEMSEFFNDIKQDRNPVPGLFQAQFALDVVQKIMMRSTK